MPSTELIIETRDGNADAFLFTPAGGGRWPPIIFYMDGAGIRQALLEMAERLASNGFAVLLPNLYYRHGPAGPIGAKNRRRRMRAMLQSLTSESVIADTKAFLRYLDAQPAVQPPGVGALGYCLGGALALTVAAAFPGRVDAAASIHGARLATAASDSPHRRAAEIEGEIYVAVAERDPRILPGETEQLESALSFAEVSHTIEVYPGTRRGFALPGEAAFDPEASEHHWAQLLALFKRNVSGSLFRPGGVQALADRAS
jgi:carboxymethylenebutenolidase